MRKKPICLLIVKTNNFNLIDGKNFKVFDNNGVKL